MAEAALERLDLDALDREAVLFLVGRHLEMSAALRRDIFDPETVRAFAAKVETPERLKMLCLLTYADIKAVNPEALSPWKAENIWQLYIATANHLNRNLDQRFHVDAHDEVLEHLRTLAPATGKHVETFLEGLPRRYLLTHAAGDVFAHADMATNLGDDPVQMDLRRGRHWYRIDSGDAGPSVSFCDDGRGSGGVGNEHCESVGVFESGGDCGGHILFHRHVSHAGTESLGVGAVQGEHSRRAAGETRSRADVARSAAGRNRIARRK